MTTPSSPPRPRTGTDTDAALEGGQAHRLALDVPIRFWVLGGFLLSGLLPVLVVSLMALNTGTAALTQRAEQQLQSVVSLKKEQLLRYFKQRQTDVTTLAQNPYVRQAAQQLCEAFRSAGGAESNAFRGLNQGKFLAPESYRQVHDRYLPYFAGIARNLDYYDLFFIDPSSGEVCFTVVKETDFGIRVTEMESPLSWVWKNVVAGEMGVLSDTGLYEPSLRAAAQFVAGEIRDDSGQLVAVLALQIGQEGLQQILEDRAGMGQTGEAYLVGPDFRMRSDSLRDPARHSVKASFQDPESPASMQIPSVRQALAGQAGSVLGDSYSGSKTLAGYAPVPVAGVTWALVAEMEEEEIRRDIDAAYNRHMLVVLAVSALVVLVLGVGLSRWILGAISRLTTSIAALGKRVKGGEFAAQATQLEQGTDFRNTVAQVNELIQGFVSVLDMIPMPIGVVGCDGHLRFGNESLAQLLGISRANLAGADFSAAAKAAGMQEVPADQPDTSLARHPAGLAYPEALKASAIAQRTTFWNHSSGPRHFLHTAAPLQSGTTCHTGAIEVLVDQTKVHLMAAENAGLLQRVHDLHKLDSLGTLAGGIAHDFNNILGYLLAYLDIAQRQLGPSNPAADAMAKVEEGVQRASDLVQQVLAFSGQARRPNERLDLGDIAIRTLELARPVLPATITLEMDVHTGCVVRGEAGRIQQVVLNLFTNAWQAMPEGGRLTVTVDEVPSLPKPALDETPQVALPPPRTQSQPAAWCRLALSDTGEGIAAQNLPRIFEPFFSTKASGKGSGLGLSVVHGVVRSMGGHVIVSSKPRSGTRFEVYLAKDSDIVQTVG